LVGKWLPDPHLHAVATPVQLLGSADLCNDKTTAIPVIAPPVVIFAIHQMIERL
jgi:hypothetical protein